MDAFPVFLDVKDRTALVFGGGAEAASKLRLLLKTTANVIVVAPEVDGHEMQLDRATHAATDPLAFDVPADTAIAYAATGDRTLDAAIATRLRAHGVTVCAADQPDVSDFSTPAIVDRDPVVVAIGTEGTAPVLAREIKRRVEGLLPSGLGRIARNAGRLRERVARLLAPGAPRRDFWHRLFGPALSGWFEGDTELFDRAARELLDGDAAEAKGSVAFVGAGPGTADLLTRRAAHLLDRADVVLFDALVHPSILELARREAVTIDVGKRAGAHAMRQEEIEALIVRHALEGSRVVRLKGGDPSVFGRLGGEIDAARAVDLPIEVVPGVTSASAAAASTLAPLTERGRAQELRLVTAHGETGDADDVDWAGAAASTAPLAVYMGRRQASEVQRRLVLNGRDAATSVVLVENAGRPDERVAHATLGTLAEAVAAMGGSGPLMMLIGVRSRLADTLLTDTVSTNLLEAA